MAELSLVNVTKKYKNDFCAVKNFTLEIKDKEFLILVGPSGCGKSTTLRMIAGLDEISSGELWMDGKLINFLEPGDRDLSMVFQNYALYPHMTVYQNMAFGLQVHKVEKEEIRRRVMEAAQILEMDHLLDRKPAALSGGQRQRVAIGSVIVRKPGIFLMDEPLSNLDAKLRTQMRVELLHLHKRLGATIIYVTHDQVEAMTLGTRIVVMKDGVIGQVAPPAEIYNNPEKKFVAGFIGSPSMNFLTMLVRKQMGKVYLEFEGHRICMKDEIAKILSERDYDGRQVTVGVRPEDLHLEGNEEDQILFHPEVKEMLGAEQFIHGTAGSEPVCIRLKPEVKLAVGETIPLHMDQSRIHLFDRETEENILYRQEGDR